MNHLTLAIALTAVIATAAAVATAQEQQPQPDPQQQDSKGCLSSDPGQRIKGCTAVIEAPDTTPEVRAEAFFRRGLSWSEYNEYERAIQDYSETLKILPEHSSALNNRAYSWLKLGKPQLGLPDAESAIGLPAYDAIMLTSRGKNAVFMSTRGEIRQALGDRDGAIRDHEEAMSGGPYVVKGYQCSLRLARLYEGPVDGILRPEVTTALRLCVEQGAGCAPVPAFLSTECLDPVG